MSYIQIPKIIKEECPLPEPYVWQDEDGKKFASMGVPDSIRTYEQFVGAIFKPGDAKCWWGNDETEIDEPLSLEDTCRWVYAQFLMGSPK